MHIENYFVKKNEVIDMFDQINTLCESVVKDLEWFKHICDNKNKKFNISSTIEKLEPKQANKLK